LPEAQALFSDLIGKASGVRLLVFFAEKPVKLPDQRKKIPIPGGGADRFF